MGTPKLLCDEMLHGLGRWLRAAGYDTLIAEPGTPDRELVELACHSGRIMITRDVKLVEIRGAKEVVVLLRENELEDCIRELSEQLRIDWQHAPFSRCLVCNTPLQTGDKSVRQRVPADILETNETILYCPQCDKPYWWGSHTDRMAQRLAQFARQTRTK